MNEIHKSGAFLDTDENGDFISDSSADKITPPWCEAVEYARQLEVRHLGDRLHSLYLRGSIARGTALPGRSDLDLFAVVFNGHHTDSSSSRPQFQDVLRRFPFITSVESSHITLAEVFGPFHYYRFMMKISAVCIHGQDLLPEISPCNANAPIAGEWFRIFPHLVDHFVKEMDECNDEDSRTRLCHEMMKGFLRAGMLLVMKRRHGYTRDLYPSYECFSRYYPEKEPAMRRCLELAVNPISTPQMLLPFVKDLAGWMRVAAEEQFGELELLPSSLVR